MVERTQEEIELLKLFGARLHKFRKEAGLTQKELAEKSVGSRSIVSDTEAGTRNLSLLSIYKLAKGLEIPLHLLINLDDPHTEAD